MKIVGALVLVGCMYSSATAQTNLGVSIGINQPGVYGQVNIGNYPPPRLINQQPIVIVQSPIREPMYLYVPPGHQKHWAKHCHEYNGCGRPVYFVREDWVRERYEQDRLGQNGRDGRDKEHGHGHDHRKKRKHEDN
jgi:hypothetical protein